MCIIVDANAAHKLNGVHPDGIPVLKWLLRGNGKLVVSSEILSELTRTMFIETILDLDRAGRVCRVNEDEFHEVKQRILQSGALSSDDPHVVATVICSGCDIVFSSDQNLHKDLKNRQLVRSCAIYQVAAHSALLGTCRC